MRWLRLVGAVLVVGAGTVAHAQPVPRPARSGPTLPVKIDSNPQQAEVYLDDKKYGLVGYTPYEAQLARGDYLLILELPGYQTVTRKITVDTDSHDFAIPMAKGTPAASAAKRARSTSRPTSPRQPCSSTARCSTTGRPWSPTA